MTAPSSAAIMICSAAVARGPLIRHGKHYRFGRRLFTGATVAALRNQGASVTVLKAPLPKRNCTVSLNEQEIAAVKKLAVADERPLAQMLARLVREAMAARTRTESDDE